jgi:hypothetical protein
MNLPVIFQMKGKYFPRRSDGAEMIEINHHGIFTAHKASRKSCEEMKSIFVAHRSAISIMRLEGRDLCWMVSGWLSGFSVLGLRAGVSYGWWSFWDLRTLLFACGWWLAQDLFMEHDVGALQLQDIV